MFHPIRINVKSRSEASSASQKPKTLCLAGLGMTGKVMNFGPGKAVKFGKMIGIGHYSVVYDVQLLQHRTDGVIYPPTITRCACKIVDRSKLSPSEVSWLKRELTILNSLRDVCHVCHLEGYEERDELSFILTSFIEGCTLAEYKKKMRDIGVGLNYNQIQDILCQLLKVVSEIHKRGIVHRDIKPENILISSHYEGPERRLVQEVYLCDFGLSCVCSKDGYMDEAVGTPLYAAPEIYSHRYNFKCDLWSIGVVLLWLATDNKSQFCPYNMHNLSRKGVTKERYIEWYGVGQLEDADSPKDIIDLFRSLCRIDSNERFSAEEALICPYFSTLFI